MPVVLNGVAVLKGAIGVKTGVVGMAGAVIDGAIPVVLRATGTVNGVAPQPTAVIPGISTRSPYTQYGDAEFVLFVC